MSSRLTASGLQSSAGLFGQCGVYNFVLNGSIFDPQDLNPYLLFDAETSMIGTLENPTLDLDPSKPETLDVITATRSGSATFVNILGQIETAPANTVRVDHVDSVPMILSEPSATNLLPYSEDFSQWSTKSGATLTANYGISPDGTQNSTRLQFSGASNQLADNITTSSSSTGSVYVKGTSGETIRFGVFASEANFTLNGSWQRIQKQGTATSNILTLNTYGGATARDLEIWGGQLEDGSVATSLIPTSGGNAAARTRAADGLLISGSDFSDFYNTSQGTVYVESITDSEDSTRYILQASSSVGNPYTNRFTLSYNKNGNLQQMKTLHKKDNVTQFESTTVGTFTVGELTRAALSYKTGDFRFSADGAAELTPSGLKVPAPSINQIHLGATHTGSLNLNGRIRRLIFWPYSSDNL